MKGYTIFLVLYLFSVVYCETLWRNVQLDWTNPSTWIWKRYGAIKTIPSRVFATPGQMKMYYDPQNTYSNPGFQGPIYTAQAYGPGTKAFYVKWKSNSNSATVIELLSEQLMAVGQFSSSNCWPNCGEIDVWEMLLQPNISSPYYGSPRNYGKMTLHKGDRNSACSCPSRGGNNIWYQNNPPMSSACAAEFNSTLNIENNIVTIFDQDSLGQFIQFIQYPVITNLPNGTTTITVGPNSVATVRIYNNATTFYGSTPQSCPQGSPNAQTGWPFYNQAMHLILWEQDYTANSGIPGDTLGEFQVLDVKIWLPANSYNGTNATPTTGAAGSGNTSTGGNVSSSSTTTEGESANSMGVSIRAIFSLIVLLVAIL